MTDNTLWSHIFDFAQSDGGWTSGTVAVGPAATYSVGIGWSNTDWQNPANNCYRGEYIQRIFPASTITSVVVTYDVTLGGTNTTPQTNYCFDVIIGSTDAFHIYFADQTSGIDKTAAWSGNLTGANSIKIANTSSYFVYPPECSYAGSATIHQVVITGLGINPFLTSDASECPCNYVGVDQDTVPDYF